MSGILDEPQGNIAQSTIPPRKRSRPDSGCDLDSGLGSSDGSSGSGGSVNGASVESDDNEDGRQAGSQKRARSEGHGSPDIPHGAVSWSRGTQATRHISGTIVEDSSVDSLIPLPVTLREAHRDAAEVNHVEVGETGAAPTPHTAHEDLARSMAFDQHMDALRNFPTSSSAASSTSAQSGYTDNRLTTDISQIIDLSSSDSSEIARAAGPILRRVQSPDFFEGNSTESAASHEATEPESQVTNELGQSGLSDRLHTLADTASRHLRISRLPGHGGGPAVSPLPPVDTTFASDLASSASSHDSIAPMPRSRLRLFRRSDHIQPRSLSRSPVPHSSPTGTQERHRIGSPAPSSGTGSQATRDVPSMDPHAETSSVPSIPPSVLPPITLSLQTEVGRSRHRQALARNDWFQDMRDIFDPFEPFSLDERLEHQNTPSPLVTDLTRPGVSSLSDPDFGHRRRSGQTSHEQSRPVSNDRETYRHTETVSVTSSTLQRPQEQDTDLDGRIENTRRQTVRGLERYSSGSLWTGLFDESDSERDGSPRLAIAENDVVMNRGSTDPRQEELGRPTSVHASRRHPPGLDQERSPVRATWIHDNLNNDSHALASAWGSTRRPPSVVDRGYIPSASSSSSFPSTARSSSRSLLDPTLRFGAPNPRSSWSSGPERELDSPHGRSRRGLQSGTSPWRMDDDSDPFGLERAQLRHQTRPVERPAPFSPFFPSTDDDNTLILRHPMRRMTSSRDSSGDDELPWIYTPLPGRSPGRHPTFRSTSGFDSSFASTTAASEAHSSELWRDGTRDPDPLGLLPRSSNRRADASPTRSDVRNGAQVVTGGGARRLGSLYGFGDPSVTSRMRLRQQLGEAPSPDNDFEQRRESMEDIIPESNTRNGGLSGIDSPPSPVEPRLSSLDVGPRPGTRLPHRRFRPPSPSLFSSLMRPDNTSQDATHFTSTSQGRPQRGTDSNYQSLFDIDGWQRRSGFNEATSGRHLSPDGNQSLNITSRLEAPIEQRRRNLTSWSWPPHSNISALVRGTSETFSELVRRRAARADAQARMARRSPSPDAISRPTYRLPRPSSLFDEAEDIARRRERLVRLERRRNAAIMGLGPTIGGSGIDESSAIRWDRELVRQEIHNDNLPLERPLAPRPTFGERLTRSNSYLANLRADRERLTATIDRHPNSEHSHHDEDPSTGASTQSLPPERERQAFGNRFPGPGVSFQAGSDSGSREREQLHDAINRHSRDDEDRLAFPRLERSRARGSLSDETSQDFRRHLREPEDVGRALRALDQWGELEGSGEPDIDPTRSHLHRFGETMRRRRVPSAFSFGSTAVESDSFSGTGSSNTARQGRRSPSPPSASARLQARQARFARAQGRYRELGGDLFGEPRSRSSFASRLDMLGGSRLTSRFLSRNLGDYMRDEDFDASYENLVRLAAVIGDVKPRGTPAHLLAAMPTGFYKDFAVPGCETRCPICLDDYNDLDPVLRISDCDHWFHKECLEQWLQGARSCPLCKSIVRGRTRGQKPSSDDTPGPSGSRRDDGSDDESPSGDPSGSPERVGSPGLSLEELGSYAAGW